MQGLADGYFVLPNTINNYLADFKRDELDEEHAAFVKQKRRRVDVWRNCWR